MPFPDNNLDWLILAGSPIFSVALKRKIKEVPNPGDQFSVAHVLCPLVYVASFSGHVVEYS